MSRWYGIGEVSLVWDGYFLKGLCLGSYGIIFEVLEVRLLSFIGFIKVGFLILFDFEVSKFVLFFFVFLRV